MAAWVDSGDGSLAPSVRIDERTRGSCHLLNGMTGPGMDKLVRDQPMFTDMSRGVPARRLSWGVELSLSPVHRVTGTLVRIQTETLVRRAGKGILRGASSGSYARLILEPRSSGSQSLGNPAESVTRRSQLKCGCKPRAGRHQLRFGDLRLVAYLRAADFTHV